MKRWTSKAFGRTARAGIVVSIIMIGWCQAAGARQVAATSVTAITLQRAGDMTVVVIEADGALPEPTPGVVENPPRIFLDFPGLLTRPRAVPVPGDALVRRVRAALHSSDPRVARVVIDLFAAAPFQIDRSALADGRLMIRIGQVASPAEKPPPVAPLKPPAQGLPAPPPAQVPPPVLPSAREPAVSPDRTPLRPEAEAPPATPPSSSPSPRPVTSGPPAGAPPAATSGSVPAPRRGGDRYRQQVGEALDKARALRSVLSAIDRSADQEPEVLETTAVEFDAIRRVMAAGKPPEGLQPTHDMVVRACTLAAMAARLRAEAKRTGDPAVLRNAASAAAGALLLIDRACVELGCAP